MYISEAIRRNCGDHPGKGVVGHEREQWYDVAKLRVASGTLDIVDVCAFDFVRVEVPIGTYFLEARLIDFGGCLRISRLRARAEGAVVTLGPECGRVAVDLASVAVADFQDVRNGLTTAECEELDRLIARFSVVVCDVCELRFESKDVHFVVCQSGLGDGRYPVFALNSGGKSAGLEVEFIRDGYTLRG